MESILMAIYLSDFLNPSSGSVTGGGAVTQISDQYAYHALSRDADGLLTYTKVLLNGTESIELTDSSGFAFNGLEDMLDGKTDDGTDYNMWQTGTAETGKQPHETNIDNRNHEQFRFDNLKLYYYLDPSTGKLVARYKQDYVYAATGGSTAV
jgi:hypothetical protein